MTSGEIDLTAEQKIHMAVAALNRGDLAAAEHELQNATAKLRDTPTPIMRLVQVLTRGSQTEKVMDIAEEVARSNPSGDVYALLARVARHEKRLESAEDWAAKAISMGVNLKTLHTMRGEIAQAQGYFRKSIRHFKSAFDITPTDPKALLKYCYALSLVNAIHVAVQEIEVFLVRTTPPDHVLSEVLTVLAAYKESGQRRVNGLSPSHGESFEDLDFRFTTDELSRCLTAALRSGLEQADTVSLGNAANATIAMGRLWDAAPIFKRLRSLAKSIPKEKAINLDDAFLSDLACMSNDAISENLPHVQDLKGSRAKQDMALYAACDIAYFRKFGLQYVGSICRHHPTLRLHLHVYDLAGEEQVRVKSWLDEIEKAHPSLTITLSTEDSGFRDESSREARCYYNAIRFVRFSEFAANFHGRCFITDMDFIFNQSPVALFEPLLTRDVSFWLLPARYRINSKIAAGLVGVSAAAPGRDFLRMVAAYIAKHHSEDVLPWGIDQIALYIVFADQRRKNAGLSIAPITPQIYDGRFGTDTVVWPQKCASDDPDLQRYVEALTQIRVHVGGFIL